MADVIYMVGQLLGLVSYAIGVYCFFQKDDRKLKIFMFVLQFNNCLHFALLGAPTAVLSAFLSLVRSGLSLKTSSRLVAWLFIALSIAVGTWLAERWLDMLPIAGTCIGTYALFCLTGIRMRVALLVGASFWLANNIVVGSIGGTLLEITLISVNASTIFRLWRSSRPVSPK